MAEIMSLSTNLSELIKLPSLNTKERNYLYTYATNKCQIGDFKSAIPLFQFLVLLEKQNLTYLKGLAGALHGAGNYAQAVELYRLVYIFDIQLHFDTLFYMGDCYLNLKNFDEARENLNLFVKLASNDIYKEKFDAQLKRAQLLLAGTLKP